MARIIDGDKKNLIGGNLRNIRTRLKISQQALSNKLSFRVSTFDEGRYQELRIFPEP